MTSRRCAGPPLRRWASGRLPRWARDLSDTPDLVQETLFQTFRKINGFEHRGEGALQAYLRQAVMNRIRDEIRRLVERNAQDPLPVDSILNVNVPDVPQASLKGIRTTRLGFRHKSEPAMKALDPHNRPIWWIGPAGAGQDAGPGTDFHAVAEGFVSVSPIKVDLTAHAALEQVGTWFHRL